MACIEARGLRKAFGTTVALDGIDLRVEEGRILGLIGPNGAGKTTALNAILGLTPYQGELKVLGRDPWTERDQLMRDVCFIADVAVLPRWMRVSQALDYVAGVHPRFDRAKAEGFLAKTTIKRASKVRELSKGMVAQLHLALVMAIDAKLLVLDEPTLGLDILYRKQFYDSLLNDYFDRSRTIVVTTHQVEEIQDVLTDVMFINRGRIVFDCSMEEFESRYLEVMVNPEQLAAARALKPMHERQVFGRSICCSTRRTRATRRAWRSAHAEHRRFVRGGDWAIQAGAPHKERRDEYSIERRHRILLRIAGNSRRDDLGEPAHVLVGAARIVGEPFDLSRAAGRRRRLSVRLFDQHDWPAGQDAAPAALDPAQQHEAVLTPYDMAAGLIMLTAFIVGMFYSSGRAARRTPRSQHPVLEVAAGFRPHDSALEGEHSARRSSAAQHSRSPLPCSCHAAAEQRSTAGERPECRDALDTVVVCPDVADAALPPSYRACALVRAILRLAAAGLRLGAARGVSVGGFAAAGDRDRRKNCVQHLVFHRHAAAPAGRRHRSRHSAGDLPHGSDDAHHSRSFPEQSGSVARLGNLRGIFRRSSPAAALSRTNLKICFSVCHPELAKSLP